MSDKHTPHPYAAEAAPEPLGSGDWSLTAMLRHLAADGVTTVSRSGDLLPHHHIEQGTDAWHLAWARYLQNFYRFSGDYNLYLALTALAKHSEEDATEVVRQILGEYDAGDSYGEWLWQWAVEQGLNPERIVAEDKACAMCAGYVGREVAGS